MPSSHWMESRDLAQALVWMKEGLSPQEDGRVDRDLAYTANMYHRREGNQRREMSGPCVGTTSPMGGLIP